MTLTISHNSRWAKTSNHNGFGYATEGMLTSLERLGYKVATNSPTADVQIWFDQPPHWKWYDGPYRIGYCPWESTELKEGWLEKFNECDEVWTPSPLIAGWFKDAGIKPPIYVYQHGIDKIWTPVVREKTDTFNFLHIDGSSLRKGAFYAMPAIQTAFAGVDDVRLYMKINDPQWTIGSFGKNVIVNRVLSTEEMVGLYHSCHAYVYPSYGEGFGLTPLQSMATGMPTITTTAWAPYHDLIDPRLSISSYLAASPWSDHHPGKMFRPNFDEMVDMLRWTYNNYDEAQAFAHAQVPTIQARYDWDTITKDVFDNLSERLKSK